MAMGFKLEVATSRDANATNTSYRVLSLAVSVYSEFLFMPVTSVSSILARSGRCYLPKAFFHRRCLSVAGTRAPPTVDVLVIGGGLVGASFAAAVAANPLSSTLSVAVVDPSPPPPVSSIRTAQPSLRTSTISPSSQQFLSDAGAWQHVPPPRIAPFTDMLVWDRPAAVGTDPDESLGTIAFGAADLPDRDELGVVVDNDTLRAAIYERLQALSETAELYSLATDVQSISYAIDEDEEYADTSIDAIPWPKVVLGTGETISARLIVAADGVRSRVRTLAQFDWFKYAYGQSAVVANVALDRPISTAYQRFLSTGPIALLPIAAENFGGVEKSPPMGNVIWSTTPTEAEALLGADDVVFLDELNAAFRDADEMHARGAASAPADIGGVLNVKPVSSASSAGSATGQASGGLAGLPKCEAIVGKRGSFPLSMGHAPRYVDAIRRTVLLGDAAHNVHPLAGQGANLGFADARSLSDALASAAATGRDVGGEEGAPLMRYERERVAANVAMMFTLHTIRSLFGLTSSSAFNLARRMGVSALDNASPLKRMILKVMS